MLIPKAFVLMHCQPVANLHETIGELLTYERLPVEAGFQDSGRQGGGKRRDVRIARALLDGGANKNANRAREIGIPMISRLL